MPTAQEPESSPAPRPTRGSSFVTTGPMGGAGLRGPIEPVVIFSYQKNVRLEGIDPFSGYLISVTGHIPGRAPGRSSVFSRSDSRSGMPSFELNPTFTALKPPFCSSYGVVLRCLWIVMALTVDRLWIDRGGVWR